VLVDRRDQRETPATEPRVGLLGDIADELRWTFSGRKGWLLSMVANLLLALVVVGYQSYDPHASGDIKIAHVGIAVVLYVLADTVNTNQLGADSDRVQSSLERGDSVRRILAIKNLALAVLLVPVALLVSVAVRVLVGRWRLLPNTAMYDVGAVFLWLGLGNVVSVLLPYRPISIRARLKARPTWKRWVGRQATPYALYYLGVPLLLLLPFIAASLGKAFGPLRSVEYPLLFVANSIAAWLLGLWLASGYTRRHYPRVIAELRRPE
jgi:hypothetical protein